MINIQQHMIKFKPISFVWVFAILLLLTGTKTYAQQTPLITQSSAYFDTSNVFDRGIIINLSINNLDQVKQINCRMYSEETVPFMGNDSLMIENKFGSLFFRNKGRYKQAYGKTIQHRIPLYADEYDKIKSIEFSLTDKTGTEGQKTTIILR